MTNIALHFIFQAFEKLVVLNFELKPQLGKPRWNSPCNWPLSLETFQTLCHPRRPRDSQSGREKRRDKSFQACVEGSWMPTLTGSFPNCQANGGSWLGTRKNALCCCAQSANSISWILLCARTWWPLSDHTCSVSSPEKSTQSGNFQFDISPAHFKILSTRKVKRGNVCKDIAKTLFQKNTSLSLNTYLSFHRSRLHKYYLPYLGIGQKQNFLIDPKWFPDLSVVPSFLVRKVENENFLCTHNLGERTGQV